MKKLTAAMAVMLFATIIFAQKMQEKNVPANIKSAFQKKYPSAASVKWDKEEEKYEASFDLNKTGHSVLMDAQANISETEVEIELSQLPTGILDYVKNNYTGRKVKEAAKITDAKGIVTYEAEIKGMDLIFDSNGIFVKELKD